LVVNSFRLVFMYTRISYIYRLGRGNICNDLKYCLQLMFFRDLYHSPLLLSKYQFRISEFPQNISPYNNKEWKYAQYKVRTVSNPDTSLITLIAKHILLNLVASCWVCTDHFIFCTFKIYYMKKNYKPPKYLICLPLPYTVHTMPFLFTL
jgi:hypothetical protein